MSLTAKLRRAPLRIATGAYILNSGIGKFRGDEETAKALHGMASNAYPVFEKADHKLFTKALAVGEVALGTTLLLPVAPPIVAGAALMAFSGGLLGLYWRTPHLHLPNDPRPTQDGVSIAKDVWMFGIGTGLVLDAMTAPMHDKKKDVAHQMKQSTAVNTAKAGALTGAAATAATAAAATAAKSATAGAKGVTAGAKTVTHAAKDASTRALHTANESLREAAHDAAEKVTNH